MNVLSLLSANSFLVVNKILAKRVGIDAAILFADLAGSQIYWETKERLIDGFFFRSQNDIEEQTTLSSKTQLRCLRILENEGFIKTKMMGMPYAKHYSIDESCLAKLLSLFSQKGETSLAKREKQVSPKGRTIKNINIENINNENRIMKIEDVETSSTPIFFEPQESKKVEILNPKHTPQKKEKSCAKKEKKPSGELEAKDAPYFNEVLEVLEKMQDLSGVRLKIPTNYKPFLAYGGYKAILARLKDGATVDEMLKVCELKAMEWLPNAKMRQYFTYNTLFEAKSNFEKYLMQIQLLKNDYKTANNGKQQQQQSNFEQPSKFQDWANDWLQSFE